MIVIRIAITPSLNASRRPLPTVGKDDRMPAEPGAKGGHLGSTGARFSVIITSRADAERRRTRIDRSPRPRAGPDPRGTNPGGADPHPPDDGRFHRRRHLRPQPRASLRPRPHAGRRRRPGPRPPRADPPDPGPPPPAP